MSAAHSRSQLCCPFAHNVPPCAIHSLLHFFGGEVQVSVIDPLDLEPVLEIVVSAAAKLHLQSIDGLLLETASRHVRVLVETDAVSQTHLARNMLDVISKSSSAIVFTYLFYFLRRFSKLGNLAELVVKKKIPLKTTKCTLLLGLYDFMALNE